MLRFDIEKLQISPRPEVFKIAFKLFIEKYQKISEEKVERDKRELLEFLEYCSSILNCNGLIRSQTGLKDITIQTTLRRLQQTMAMRAKTLSLKESIHYVSCSIYQLLSL